MKIKKVFMLVVLAAVCLLLSTVAFADGVEPEEELALDEQTSQSQTEETGEISVTQDEISVLREEIAELRAALADLQMAQAPERVVSIGVLPIENAWRIPEVGESLREVFLSALSEAGINTVESLDSETLNWVLEQDRLVRERLISPITAPPRGDLRGVTHFLFGTVTQYREETSNQDSFGPFVVSTDGVSVRHGFLSVDFRLVDATTGVIVGAFTVEKYVKERTGPVLFDGSWDPRPVSEIACRSVAEQAAERIAELLNPAPAPIE